MTSNSNAACDEITERLLQVLNPGDVFRLYSQSFDPMRVSEKIKPFCNLQKDGFLLPSLQFIYQFRVVVSTLITAGFMTRARGVDDNFDESHFSYIIIDEAACAQEQVLMCAIAGTTCKK